MGREPELRTSDLLPAPRELTRDLRGRALTELRLSVIDRCNYRCPYCMPAEHIDERRDFLAPPQRLMAAEIEQLVRSFVRLGVRKLRLTGGEPLLRPDLPAIVEALVAIPGVEDLALTTNGSLLARRATDLRAAGLHRLTVSLDALDATVYARMSGGRGAVSDVLAGIEQAERAGFGSLRINCVVQRGVNDQQLLPLVRHFRGTPHVLRFIEYMDVGTLNAWSPEAVVTREEMLGVIGSVYPLRRLEDAPAGSTSSRYVHADGAGELGFVASVSAPFCGDCGRARVTADGQLYTCLFGASGTDLRQLLRAGLAPELLAERLDATLDAVWRQRSDRYSELRARRQRSALPVRVQMYAVGG